MLALYAAAIPSLMLSARSAVRAPAPRMAEAVSLDTAVLDRYMSLPVKGKVQAEYLWIDADGDLRSKCRTVDAGKATVDQLPNWNYDGSSTGQAPGDDSEVIIKPRAIYKDPFRGGDNILVLTDTYTPGGTPLPTNSRVAAAESFNKAPMEKPWFGIEQEYTLFNLDKITPLGWPSGGYPGPQGPYYCSAGADRSYGRAVSEAHYRACLYAGLAISGTNAEVMPGQWEYQIGPCVGIDAADELQARDSSPPLAAAVPGVECLQRATAALTPLPPTRAGFALHHAACVRGLRRLLHPRPEADARRLERRGRARQLLD